MSEPAYATVITILLELAASRTVPVFPSRWLHARSPARTSIRRNISTGYTHDPAVSGPWDSDGATELGSESLLVLRKVARCGWLEDDNIRSDWQIEEVLEACMH